MQNRDEIEKANFRTLIEADSKGNVKDRLNIVDVFLNTEEHVTLEQICEMLKEKGYDYTPDFVRQCLNRGVELGFAQKKQFHGQPIRYEHRHLGRHHDHIICTKCGKIVEFADMDMETRQVKIASEHGFHMLQHRMEIYGLCASCFDQRRQLIPLAIARRGERLTIREMVGVRSARARLASLGLRPGDEIEIINNTGRGRVILGHGQTRLAIGRGIAQKIMASSSAENKDS
ncbi:MAG: Fur family transcriptional regulator [Desulfobacterales bacterium]|nr:Fur family transcriptional regulator [Desulfobacterales bacterium]